MTSQSDSKPLTASHSNLSLHRLLTTQYVDFSCSPDDGTDPTALTLNTCVEAPEDLSLNFNTFVSGACTPAECSVALYDSLDCSDTPLAAGIPVTSTECYDIQDVFGMMLTCPTCPQS
jgi:hypothetical protein